MFRDLRKYTMPDETGKFRPKADSDTCLQYDRLDGDTDSSCSIATIERPQSAKSKGADTGLTFGSPGMMALAMQRAAVVSSAAEKTP